MIARNDTGINTGFGRSGLHGYDSLRYPVPTPAYVRLAGSDMVTRFSLGDVSATDVGLIETLTDEARQAFQSTQDSAVASAMYGGGSGLIPPGVNQGAITFGGSTGILLLVGLGIAAFALAGGRKNRF
jgi:hypothetical protein